jgi:CO/xanthine dehydrogenase FAD-binding subunit
VQELHYDGPTSVADAIGLLARGQARALAGGTDLISQVREGRRTVERIVDLKRIPELTTIRREADGSWRIGAAVSAGRLGQHPEFAAEHHALVESAHLIGSLQIQNRASLGGNICNAAPSADAVPLLISLRATAIVVGPQGSRTVPVAAIAIGPGRTSLAPAEMLTAILLPAMPPRSAAKYLRFTPRREMDIAIAGVGSWLQLDADGAIIDAAITLASVAPIPLIAGKAAAMLIGERPTPALFDRAGATAATEAQPISDTRGTADYRRHLVAVLTRRTLAACVAALETHRP